MDESNARLGLILRKIGITDTRLIDAFHTIARADFVPAAAMARAYHDEVVDIGMGQIMMPLGLMAFILANTELEAQHKVLEIGTGTGYQTALMACLCRRVYSLEWHRNLYQQAEKTLRRLAISNVTCMAADGSMGWSAQAPFDRIIVNATMRQIPQELMQQLQLGGHLLVPIFKGKDPKTGQNRQRLLKITRKQQGFHQQDLIGVRFKEMIQNDSF